MTMARGARMEQQQESDGDVVVVVVLRLELLWLLSCLEENAFPCRLMTCVIMVRWYVEYEDDGGTVILLYCHAVLWMHGLCIIYLYTIRGFAEDDQGSCILHLGWLPRYRTVQYEYT